jgi:Uma2 family endonuclease
MTFTKARFTSFEDYLAAEPSDLPEGLCEYWDGELVPVMSEAFENGTIAIFVQLALIAIGVSYKLIRPICEVEVSGRPRSRIPDLTVTDEVHVTLLKKRSTITRRMPPPRLVVEVVSPGDEKSENYRRDYQEKRDQYAAIGIPEYWIIDPEREWVMVGTLISNQYEFATFRQNETIASPTFPSFNLTAAQVLEG